jgi:hypothetical protein
MRGQLPAGNCAQELERRYVAALRGNCYYIYIYVYIYIYILRSMLQQRRNVGNEPKMISPDSYVCFKIS